MYTHVRFADNCVWFLGFAKSTPTTLYVTQCAEAVPFLLRYSSVIHTESHMYVVLYAMCMYCMYMWSIGAVQHLVSIARFLYRYRACAGSNQLADSKARLWRLRRESCEQNAGKCGGCQQSQRAEWTVSTCT